MEGENWRAKRFCMSTSVEGCLKGIGYSDYDCVGKILNVYVPEDLKQVFARRIVYKPSTKQVPDADVTGEHWIKGKFMLKHIGKI